MNITKSEKILCDLPINQGDTQRLRVTKIKYEKGDATHIDLRIMQLFKKEDNENYVYTKQGCRIQEKYFRELLNNFNSNPDVHISR